MTSPAAVTRRVLLASPRGYCAGVDRAVQTVERALEAHGAPVYVRKQIVHNSHVVARLEQLGAIFVEETDEVPEGAVVVFSAHGVAPTVHEERAQRVLVVGSANSSNSVRLVEVARDAGAHAAYLVDDVSHIDERWLDDVDTVGVTSGASVPESLVAAVLDWLSDHGYRDVEQVVSAEEHLTFALPPELRRVAASR